MADEQTASVAATPSESPSPSGSDPVKNGSNKAGRLLSGSYTSLAIVGVVLFFMPWVSFSCIDIRMFDQSGYEIMAGRVHENPNWQKEMQVETKKYIEEKFGPMGAGADQAMQTREARKQFDEKTSKFPSLILFPVGLVLAAAFGVIGILANRPSSPLPALFGATLAMLAVVGCLTSDFPLEKDYVKSIRDNPAVQAFDVERLPAYTAAVIVVSCTFGLTIVHLLVYRFSTGITKGAPPGGIA